MSSIEPSVGFLMNHAARLLRKLADRRLRPLGMSSAHLPVITALLAHAELTQKELTAAASIEQPTMAEMLARMERDGIIQRRPDPADGRGSLVSLSKTVLAKMDEIKSVIETINDDSLGALPADRRAMFRRDLASVISSLETELNQVVDS